MRVRHATYERLNAGDLVRIRGERGIYKVMWIDAFEEPRVPEVTLVGGPIGHSAWRTVYISKINNKRIRKETR